MNLKHQIKLEIDQFKKCALHTDNDCPLGEMFDYLCACSSFVLGKMKENEPKPQVPVSEAPQE